MKREYPLFTLYCERNVTSAQMVQKHLKAPLFHERSGKPRAQGFQISLSDCRGITFLAVLKGEEAPRWSFEKDLDAIRIMDQVQAAGQA